MANAHKAEIRDNENCVQHEHCRQLHVSFDYPEAKQIFYAGAVRSSVNSKFQEKTSNKTEKVDTKRAVNQKSARLIQIAQPSVLRTNPSDTYKPIAPIRMRILCVHKYRSVKPTSPLPRRDYSVTLFVATNRLFSGTASSCNS